MINRKEAAVVAGMLLTGAAGLSLFLKVDGAEQKAQTEMVLSAVRGAALTCYAVEGAYPSAIGYLKEHYGLAYDEDRYLVSYDAFADNLFPEIRVVEKGG